MTMSVPLLLFAIFITLWAGESFYRQQYFIGATLTLCSFVLFFLSWVRWGL